MTNAEGGNNGISRQSSPHSNAARTTSYRLTALPSYRLTSRGTFVMCKVVRGEVVPFLRLLYPQAITPSLFPHVTSSPTYISMT